MFPKGKNRMLDTFKAYGKEVGYLAILSDSLMMISACLIGSYFANLSLNTNLILLVLFVYLIPYLIYT